jgi:hypothetical protein
MDTKIAVRFYDNNKFGTTYAKGLYRKAVFNGTADLQQPNTKYLLDMLSYDDWENSAKTNEDMRALELAEDLIEAKPKADWLCSFIKRFDSNGNKSPVMGFCIFDLDTHQLTLAINDAAHGIVEAWQLEAKPCKSSSNGKKVPQLLATNAELT